jgi:hypothetical protein
MVKERRSAADALALSPQIEEFIAKGISPTVVESRSEKVVQMKTDPEIRLAESEIESDLPNTESQEPLGQSKSRVVNPNDESQLDHNLFRPPMKCSDYWPRLQFRRQCDFSQS